MNRKQRRAAGARARREGKTTVVAPWDEFLEQLREKATSPEQLEALEQLDRLPAAERNRQLQQLAAQLGLAWQDAG
jgi:hypothetical protein